MEKVINNNYKFPAIAIVKWPSNDSVGKMNFRGYTIMKQFELNGPVHIKVRFSGLKPNSLHGFHIHESPITSITDLNKSCGPSNETDVKNKCDSCKGHFNPLGEQHGSILNKGFGHFRHVGDLINNIRADGSGRVKVNFIDDLVNIYPTYKKPYTIIGRSLVVHEGIDDLGREGRSKKMPYIDGIYGNEVVGNSIYEVNSYNDIKLRESSLINGNAGSRIACGNILEFSI